MTTTMVVNPSPTQLSFPPQPQSLLPPQQHSTEHKGEKFPSFEDSRLEEKVHAVISPRQVSSPVNPPSVNNWPVRKSSQTSWENRNGGGLYKHRPRKSVTEAFDNLRQRRGSISANTHELAEALKAPISYKLIVRAILFEFRKASTVNIRLGALHCLVPDVSAHQHILKVHIECVSETGHTDDRSICVCFAMVSCLCLLGFDFPQLKDSHSGAEERYQTSVEGGHRDCDAFSRLSASGSSPQLHRYV